MAFAAEKADYDVVIVGAGISGINFAYRLQERNPELSFTILENRHEVGGTWSLFNYPGESTSAGSTACIFVGFDRLTRSQAFDLVITSLHVRPRRHANTQ